MGDSSDILFITAKPIINTAKTLINTSKVVSPILVKSGTKLINKAGQSYDDLTLGMTKVVEKVSPTLANPQNAKRGKDFIDGFDSKYIKLPLMKNKAHNLGYGTRKMIKAIGE